MPETKDLTSKPAPAEPVRIVPPADFPVEWESAEEASLLWSWDNFHSPLPPSPMTISVDKITAAGTDAANRAFGMEAGPRRRKTINGYPYGVVEARSPTRRGVREAIAVTADRWREEFLPELEADLAFMKSVDLAALSDSRLLDHLDRVLEKAKRHWEIHFLVVYPVHAAVEQLKESYESIMGEGAGEGAYALIDAATTKTVEVNRALAALGDRAKKLPAASAAIMRGVDARQVLAELQETDDGRAWLADFHDFMDEYGYRPSGYDMRFPTWREDPSFVLVAVRGHIGTSVSSESERSKTRAGERAMAEVEAALRNRPADRAKFMARLASAREIWHLKEDHGFYIDQATQSLVRMSIAEVGRRLARRSVIADGEDVFYLDLDEAREVMARPVSMHEIVAGRKSDIERWARLSPPRYLGALPADTPPEDALAQVHEAARAQPAARTVLAGQPASRGVASGPARIVKSPADFGKVRTGDVLVCRSTSPTWTPLFGVVAALVSEAGGILSHPAIIAREHGLPAVVGVAGATDLLSDGQPVSVDGNTGAVRLAGTG